LNFFVSASLHVYMHTRNMRGSCAGNSAGAAGAEGSREQPRGPEGPATGGMREREREREREEERRGPWRAPRSRQCTRRRAVHQLFIVAPVYALFVVRSPLAPPPPPPGPARVGARERAIVHVQHLHYPPSRLAAPVMNRSRVIGRVEKGRSSRARAHRVLLLGENRSAPHNPAVVGLKPARCGFISQSRREDN